MSPAVTALIILGVCIILFVHNRLPSVVTACLGCLAMVLCGVCPFETAFSGFSHSITLLMFGAITVGNAMVETGAANMMGRAVLRVAGEHPRRFILIGGAVAGCMSLFLANTAVMTLFFTIISGVCASSEKMRYKDLIMPISLAAVYGGACTLVGSTPQLTAASLMKELANYETGMFDFLLPGVCCLVVLLIFASTIGYNIGRKIWGGRDGEPSSETDVTGGTASVIAEPKDRRKAIIMFCIMGLMILFYITGWISTTLTAMSAAVLCILLGCIDVPTVIRKMSWESLIFLAACLGLGACITASGAGDLISQYVSRLLGESISPFPVFCFFIVISMITSQFLTNSAIIIIFLPIALSICSVYGFQQFPFFVGITLSAGLACGTPLAAPQIALISAAGYRFSDFIRYSWPLMILTVLSLIIFTPLFFPLV